MLARRRLAVLLAPVLLLAACGEDTSARTGDTSSTTPRAPEVVEESSLEDVEVVLDDEGNAPTLTFPQPFAVTQTVRKVLEEGEGEAAVPGATVAFDFLFLNGRDGSELSTSYGREPAQITFDDRLMAGVRIGLEGLRPGSQALVAIAPVDGFLGQGDDESSGILETDSLLLYLDVLSVRIPLARAEGDPVEPVEGLPTVELDEDGKPTITVPGGDAPAELVAQLLIEGDGPVVESGQTITVHYTGVLWDGGEQFDSSWDRGSPASFSIGTRAVIAGWDKGLVGQTVGSQVLLVIPAEDGYGDSGSGSIPGGATLVFVVDILDAG